VDASTAKAIDVAIRGPLSACKTVLKLWPLQLNRLSAPLLCHHLRGPGFHSSLNEKPSLETGSLPWPARGSELSRFCVNAIRAGLPFTVPGVCICAEPAVSVKGAEYVQ
jgi:hypothetical protein